MPKLIPMNAMSVNCPYQDSQRFRVCLLHGLLQERRLWHKWGIMGESAERSRLYLSSVSDRERLGTRQVLSWGAMVLTTGQ